MVALHNVGFCCQLLICPVTPVQQHNSFLLVKHTQEKFGGFLDDEPSSTVGFLHWNLSYCPTVCRQNAYLSLVRSVIEYGAVI